jgi:hypothetical protein
MGHQLSSYTDWEKSTEALLVASKETGLKANSEKATYVLILRFQKAGQKHSIQKANMSFEDVAKFKYLETH